MKRITYIIAMLTTLIALQACRHDHNESLPVITINHPVVNATYALNDTVWIEGNITHVAELHEFVVELKDITRDTVVFTTSTHTHVTSAEIKEQWINNVTQHTDMLLTITADDHDGNTTTKTVNFHCHPM